MGSCRSATCFSLAIIFSSFWLFESALIPQTTLSWPVGESVQININTSSVDSPMISSATNRFYLAVKGNSLDNGVDKFCWIAVMDQVDPDNHQQVWRSPCSTELQRLNTNESCFFGVTSGGNLTLSLGDSFPGGRIAFSNGTSEVDHGVLSDWGRILLQDRANATVWNSADVPSPPASCLDSLSSVDLARD